MKRQTLILVSVVALLLLGATALAQSDEGDPSTLYIVEQGAASGGGYILTSLDGGSENVASGGRYRLLGPEAVNASPPPSAEVGCCCTYLPCTLRNFP